MGCGHSSENKHILPDHYQPQPRAVKPVERNQPVEAHTNDMYKSFKTEQVTNSGDDKTKANTTQMDDGKGKQTVKAVSGSPDALPWRQALDQVATMELWDGKKREERDNWGEYLLRADELVKKPRKTIQKDVVRAILEGDMTSVDLSKIPNAQPKIAVFVSSTFTDTKAERNQLMKDVYPYLRLVCRRLGIDFGTVDMRWGVTEEATNDHMTTDMCVKEIHRCMKDSAGPAFLCFLGHKYGYRPLPAKIVQSEFEKMYAHLKNSGSDVSMIDSYYNKDDNAVPTEYVLRPMTKEDKTWWDDMESIQAQMRDASVACFGETDERCNKYHISVTETEVHNGVFNNPNADYQTSFIRRELVDFDSDFHKDRKILDMSGKEVDVYAKEKLTELKEVKVPTNVGKDQLYDVRYEKSSSKDCADRIRAVCDHTCKSMVEGILDSYDKRLHVKEDPEFLEAIQHRSHAIEKASLFIGREHEIGLINEYLRSDNRAPLVVHGPSGCGKTALMAVITKGIKTSHRNGFLVLRFLGTTGLSGSARNVLNSICTHLCRVYGKDVSNIPVSYKELIKYFRVCMGFATSDRPLFLVLDSLDQLSNEDLGQNLAWLSLAEELPEHVKLIVSSLPTKCLDILKAYVPTENFVEVQPLKSNEGPEIVSKMLSIQNRKITPSQENIITAAFNKCPLPLFLRLSVDIALQWHSYDDVTADDIADDMPGLITMLFDRLESKYGEMFVHHALSYITAAKDGLSLTELEDILSCDDNVLDSVFVWWVPPIRRIPPLLWARVRNDLGIYLAERGTNGISAYGWYHRQFWETAAKRYLNTTFGKEAGPFRDKAHEAIADYFEGKWENGKPYVSSKPGAPKTAKLEDRKIAKQPIVISGSRGSGRQINRRKLAELPYHFIQLGQWERFQTLTMDLKYIEADFEAGNGFNCLSELIEATKLSKIDDIKQMTRFVGANLGFLIRESAGVYQMAFQLSRRNIIRKLLDKVDKIDLPLPLMTNMLEEDFNDPCEMTLHGHTETIRTCDYSPAGDLILSSADDSTMRIWDSTTGAELVCISSLPEPVWPTKQETNQLMLHPVNPACFSRTGEAIGSGTEQGGVMIWDKSGGQIHAVKTGNLAVTSVRFSPDNKTLATSFKNGIVSFWSVEGLDELGTINVGGETTCVDYSINGDTLAVMCLLGMVLIDTTNYSVRNNSRGGCYQNLCCTYHPDGKQIMSGGDDSKVSFWDASSGVYQSGIKRHNAWIWCIKFTKDGNNMFTCSSDRSMKVWHRTSDSWEVTATVGGHAHRVSMVSIEAITENKLVTSSLDRSLKVWDTKALIRGDIPPAGQGHFTTCLASASGKYIAKSQGWFHNCTVIDSTTGNTLGTTQNHTGFIRKAQFTYDEQRLFVLDYGHSGAYEHDSEAHATIKVTSLPDMRSVCSSLGTSSPVSFSLNTQYVFVGTANGDLYLYDVEHYSQVVNWNSGTNKMIFSVATSRDTTIVAACYGNVCQVWDASASHRNHIKDLTEQESDITVSAISPNGTILVTGTNAGWLYIYKISSNDVSLLTVTKDHASYINDIKFSSTGNLMVSSAGLSMRIWNVNEGITQNCTYYAPVNHAAFLSESTVVVGEATGKQLMLSF